MLLPLTIIICTFKREKAVAENLRLLFGPKVQGSGFVDLRVIVVDQAGTLNRTEFPAGWSLRIVQQDNFGGAGGFTRGIIEAMDEGCGWILLMDDDALPDSASFRILADYIRKRRPDNLFALHGAMFSLEHPDKIYEAGARLKEPANRNFDIIQRLRGYRPSEPIQEDPELWENMGIDYGGWWFFCIHADSVRRVGLPLPLFIRGDDCEYGLRLKAAGIPTLPLPGLRAWHSEQGARLQSWAMFYDYRNKLIIHSLYNSGGRWPLAAKLFYAGFREVLSARYDRARMVIGGLRAYLEGPPHLLRPAARTAREIKDMTDKDIEQTDISGQIQTLPGHVLHLRKSRVVLQMLCLNGLFLPAKRSAGLPCGDIENFDWLRVFRLGQYALVAKDGSARVYRRNAREAMALLNQLLCSVARFVAEFGSCSAWWRRAAKGMQTRAFWHLTLGLGTAAAAPDSAQP